MHTSAGVDAVVEELRRRLRQQTAIASLSQAAIGSADLDTLLPEAIALVKSVLHLDVVAIGEFAGDGLRPDSPMVITALHEDGLLELTRRITNAPLASCVAGVIDGHQRARRVLLAGSLSPRAFTPDETEFVQGVARVLRLLARHLTREGLALADVPERFVSIFQTTPVALALTTIAHGRVIDANERWLSMFGYRRDEVIGRTIAELGIAVDPGRRAELAARAQMTGVVADLEMEVRTKSGEILQILASAAPFDAGTGEETWISALVDITDRRRAEAERDQVLAREQAARAEAEQALEQLNAVYTITDSVFADSDLGDLLGELLKRLRRTLQIDYASVLLLEDEGKALYLRAVQGPVPIPTVPPMRVPLGVGVSGRIAAEGCPMIVDDYSMLDLSAPEAAAVRACAAVTGSAMGAPFRVAAKVAGVVMATSVLPRHFTGEELKLLALAADRVAPAIERGRLIAKIRSGLERQRRLSHRLLTAQEEERRRLAVELHDELGQVLTAVKINLESLERANGRSAPPIAMSAVIRSVDEALQRVRDIALDLRPSVLDDLGLPAALRWYADRFARTSGVEAHLSIGVLPPFEPGVTTACFRVAQEALTNVGRHAQAHHVWIDLHVLAGALELNVRDDGIGFDVAAARERAIRGASVGLLGMQERVVLTGGEYEIVKVAAGGTEVRARFPLSTEPS